MSKDLRYERAPSCGPGREVSSTPLKLDGGNGDARALGASKAELKSSTAVASLDVAQREAFIAFARPDFWCFVELTLLVLYPGQKLVYAPYLELIASVLMRVDQGAKRNVIINLPPRHMKSALVSILYPAWRLGRDPTVNSSAFPTATISRMTSGRKRAR